MIFIVWWFEWKEWPTWIQLCYFRKRHVLFSKINNTPILKKFLWNWLYQNPKLWRDGLGRASDYSAIRPKWIPSSNEIVQALRLTFVEITILVQANSSLSSVQLKNVTNQLNTALIIMGDITPYRISKQQRQKNWSLSLTGRIMYP